MFKVIENSTIYAQTEAQADYIKQLYAELHEQILADMAEHAPEVKQTPSKKK